MKHFTILGFAIMMITSCGQSTSSCSIDKQLEAEFQNCMLIAEEIAKEEYGWDGFNIEQESKYIETLYVLTKHKSTVNINHGIVWYDTISDFKEDSIAWKKWYDDNKCFLTLTMVADTFDKYREPFPNYANDSVLARIMDSYPEELRDSARTLDSINHMKFQLNWPSKLKKNKNMQAANNN